MNVDELIEELEKSRDHSKTFCWSNPQKCFIDVEEDIRQAEKLLK